MSPEICRVKFEVLSTSPGQPVRIRLAVGCENISLQWSAIDSIDMARALLMASCDSINPQIPETEMALEFPESRLALAVRLVRDAHADLQKKESLNHA